MIHIVQVNTGVPAGSAEGMWTIQAEHGGQLFNRGSQTGRAASRRGNRESNE